MTWLVQEYKARVHIVPLHDTARPHVLDTGCWCKPEPDPDDADILMHRDALDRLELVPIGWEAGKP